MKIELLELALQNFQGATAVTFAPEGRNAEVRGDNGTGKTTLLNAWSWLLTGKDSAGRADFALKTLGPDGEPLHKLAHGVTARLQVNGEAVTISKTYSEKWTKKRGAPEAELTGHVNEYAVDGVPILEKEWKETIARIAPEATWRLVSSPGAFASLHWKEQRAVLLDLAGDLMDADVMASDPALAPLPGILGKRSPDDHRKAIVARRKVVAPQAEQIPARVDELLRQTRAQRSSIGRPSTPGSQRSMKRSPMPQPARWQASCARSGRPCSCPGRTLTRSGRGTRARLWLACDAEPTQ